MKKFCFLLMLLLTLGMTCALADGMVIESEAFMGCTELTEVVIPEGVTEIGMWAFSDCTALTGITLPSSVTDIGEDAFYDCDSLTATVAEGSDTAQYCKKNGIKRTYAE